jgi:tetratricopeptide (TPR) repeat protein
MNIFDKFRRKKQERKETPLQKIEPKKPEKPIIHRKVELQGIDTEIHKKEWQIGNKLLTSSKKTKIQESKIKDTSVHKLSWQDESSRKAEERLKENGIQIPWHYNDTFGEDFEVLAQRAGGVGAVFFVKSTRFGERIYAAKTLQRFLQRDYLEMPTYQQKKIADDFLEEALPWLEMGQHPNIVPVHLLENIVHPATKRNVPFVFSEFMEKGDLKNLLLEKGRFDLEEALNAGLQVCAALIHAYKHGLSAHKDLKPENIMVYRAGIYKVTDFSAGIIGTPGYMAPEQVASIFKLKDDIAIDQRADQFATGIIMLELLSGKHPFPWIIRAAYSKEEAEKFFSEGAGGIPDNMPGSLREIIARCLSPELDNRFPDISALKEALLEVYRNEFGEYRFPEVEIDDSAEWWFNRGMAFYNIGRYAGAETPLKEALGGLEAETGTEIDQAGCLVNLGAVYQSTGRFSEAEANHREALKMYKAIPGTEIGQANCLMNLGIVYRRTGKFSEAEDNLKEALRMFIAIHETEIEQANCLMNLGTLYRSTGKFNEAETNYKEALRINKAIPGTEINQADCLTGMGTVYKSIGKFSEAEANHKDALNTYKPIPGTEREQANCLMGIGIVYWETGKFSEAETNYKEALMMYKAIPGTTEIDQARCLMNLGVLYSKTQGFSKARSVLKEALMMYKAIPGTPEIDQVRCLMSLGIGYRSTGKFNEAETNYKEALMMYKAILGTERKQANCLMNLGLLYSETQEFSKAQSVLKEALEICERNPQGTEELKNVCLRLLKYSNRKEKKRIF